MIILGVIGYFTRPYWPQPLQSIESFLRGNLVLETVEPQTLIITGGDEIIGLTNGSVEIADGTFFAETTIEVRELISVDGLGKGATFIAGVDLTTDSQPIDMVTLSFNVPDGVDETRLIGFTYQDDGARYELYPVEIESGQAKLSVAHFSGYGIIAFDDRQFEPPQGDSLLGQAVKLKIEALKREMESAQWHGEDDEKFKEEMNTLVETWAKHIEVAYLVPAKQNELLLEQARVEYVKWKYYADWVEGDFTETNERLMRGFAEAIDAGAERLRTACEKQHDPSSTPTFIRLRQFVHQMGQSLPGGKRDWLYDYALGCAQFTLVIDTEYRSDSWGGPECPETVETYHGKIPLRPTSDSTFKLSGEGLIEGKKEFCGKPCAIERGSLNQKIGVGQTQVTFGRQSNDPEIKLILEVPEWEEDNQVTCTYHTEYGDNSVSGTNMDGWDDTLFNTKLKMINPERFILDEWDVVREGELYAIKEYILRVPWTWFNPEYEMTTYKLLHTPDFSSHGMNN